MSAQEFADSVNSGNAPWLVTNDGKKSDWTDSSKEQYFNLLAAEQANEMEMERWRANNEYNTPRAQMQRLIEAGINPAAAYQSVSSGNSSSAPNVHQPGTAAFHDTSDKLQRINTIMSGISSIMSTINQGVDAVAGIQGISLSHQKSFFDRMVYDQWNGLEPTLFDSPDGLSNPVQVAPGVWSPAEQVASFPRYFEALGFKGGSYDLQKGNLSIQQNLADRRTRIDHLIQNIMQGLDGHASTGQMMNYFLQLFMYGAMSKFGGF